MLRAIFGPAHGLVAEGSLPGRLLAVLDGDASGVEADAMAPGHARCGGFQGLEAKCRRDLMSQDVVAFRRDIECERAAAGGPPPISPGPISPPAEEPRRPSGLAPPPNTTFTTISFSPWRRPMRNFFSGLFRPRPIVSSKLASLISGTTGSSLSSSAFSSFFASGPFPAPVALASAPLAGPRAAAEARSVPALR